jgi:hypothetical protein
MTDNWRKIKAAEIDWAHNPISRRAGMKVRMMCNSIYWHPSSTTKSCGGWRNHTLGMIADLGEKHWLRCTNIGPLGVKVIKSIIDQAAEGKCPMLAEAGPAPDAYHPATVAPTSRVRETRDGKYLRLELEEFDDDAQIEISTDDGEMTWIVAVYPSSEDRADGDTSARIAIRTPDLIDMCQRVLAHCRSAETERNSDEQ